MGANIKYNRRRLIVMLMALSFILKIIGFLATVFLFDNYIHGFLEMAPMYFTYTILNGCFECSFMIYLFFIWSSYIRINFINEYFR